MQESLLHHIWQFQYFEKSELSTTSGELLEIFHPGYRNTNAGPDFLNARIKIGDMHWIGSIEIHVDSSDWQAHHHDLDDGYNNVVLHVVWQNNRHAKRQDHTIIPTLELYRRVDPALLVRYQKIVFEPTPIACSASIHNVSSLRILSMIEKAVMSRLEARADLIYQVLRQNNNDWEETFYQLLCKNFGFKINADAFFKLGRIVPYKTILKHSDKPLQVEALLFGYAGLLDKSADDDYFRLLKREHKILTAKYRIKTMGLHRSQFRFLRLRPANFPTIRLAQLTQLLCKTKNLFSTFISTESYEELFQLLQVNQSAYWQHHYVFKDYIEDAISGLGRMSIDNIITNTVAPVLVAYGKMTDDQRLIDRGVAFLQKTAAEDNAIIKRWRSLKVECRSGFDTQGLLELFNEYCTKKRCLDCNIGSYLISPQK